MAEIGFTTGVLVPIVMFIIVFVFGARILTLEKYLADAVRFGQEEGRRYEAEIAELKSMVIPVWFRVADKYAVRLGVTRDGGLVPLPPEQEGGVMRFLEEVTPFPNIIPRVPFYQKSEDGRSMNIRGFVFDIPVR